MVANLYSIDTILGNITGEKTLGMTCTWGPYGELYFEGNPVGRLLTLTQLDKVSQLIDESRRLKDISLGLYKAMDRLCESDLTADCSNCPLGDVGGCVMDIRDTLRELGVDTDD